MQDTYVFRGSANKTEGIISSFAVSPLLFVTGLNTGNRVKRENAIVSNWTLGKFTPIPYSADIMLSGEK